KQKLPIQDRAESESEKSDHKHQKHLAKKRCAPKRENADTTKNNKQKPPNTLLSSQTTAPTDRAKIPRLKAAIATAGK
ncbi:hypothetical protein, partial [Mycobacterium kyogaense]|uniref:hypothetical protein n=1 Tax=Mycobacterium kyogaense TaxID=2212479 RepID=UPI0019693963